MSCKNKIQFRILARTGGMQVCPQFGGGSESFSRGDDDEKECLDLRTSVTILHCSLHNPNSVGRMALRSRSKEVHGQIGT